MIPERLPSWKWWVCAALLLATMLNYMDRQTLALTATQLKTEIHLDDKRYGKLEEYFGYAFACGGIFFGFVADRIGPRRLYPVVLVGWSLAGLVSPLAIWAPITDALGQADSPGTGEYRWLLLCRTVLGFFEAGHWPCALLTARNILTDAQRPLGNSILQSGASLGAALTPLIKLGLSASGAPWPVPFLVIGTIGLLWVPLWMTLIRPGELQHRSTAVVADTSINWPRLAVQFVCLLVIVVTIAMPWQFLRAWMPKYLKEYHEYSESAADLFTVPYYLVADVGCIFFGALVTFLTARRMRVRWARLLVYGLCAGCTALLALVPSLGSGALVLVVLLVVGAGSLGAHPQYYALAQDLPARHMALLGGMLSASSWIVVANMQREIGKHINATGSYDLPFVLTGLAPLAGLAAMAVWAVVEREFERAKADPLVED